METVEWSKTRAEIYILKRLKEAAYNRKTTGGALTFGELEEELKDHIGTAKTLDKGLTRLREKGCIEKTFVKRLRKTKEKEVPAYRIMKEVEIAFPEFIRVQEHFKRLANTVDLNASPDEFVSKVCEAIASELVETWIRGKLDKKPIDYLQVEQLMEDFDFLIKKYVVYKSRPETEHFGKFDGNVFRILADIPQVSVEDEKYRKVFEELLKAVSREKSSQ